MFQKTNNTFAARHHLRIWHRRETFNGKEVWVCAATQIHRERAKVVNDLLFTGNVQALALVERPDALTRMRRAMSSRPTAARRC